MRFLKLAWVPLVLVLLFILENYLFNRWLGIIPELYLVRRTAATVALGVLLFGPAVFFRRHASRYSYLLAVSTIVGLIFLSQFLYYKYSGGFLQFSALTYAGEAADVTGTIKTLLTAKLLLFAVPLAAVAAGWRWSAKELVLRGREKLLAAGFMLIIVVSGYGGLLYLEKQDWGDTSRLFYRLYDLGTLVGKVGIVNYYLEDAVKFAFQQHGATAKQTALIEQWNASRSAPVPGVNKAGLAKGRNLIIIQVESLENWIIGYKVGGQEAAPNLTRLARQGLYFSNYYAQIGQGNSADAEFSALTSLYPLPESVAFITKSQNKETALPAQLKNNGYHTYVLHGDVATFWNRANIYPQLGYEHAFTRDDFTIPRPVGFDGLGDADFFSQAIAKLQSLPQPFMATLITLSMHTPFEIPADLQALAIPKDTKLTQAQQDYLQSTHYTDQAIGNFLDQLQQTGLADKSLVAIYGDHWTFMPAPADSAQPPLAQALPRLAINHVPLILLASGSKLTGEVTAPTSHLDLYPTLANLLGLAPPRSILGQDALNTANPVEIQRKTISGAIDNLQTARLAYQAAGDGVFEHGTCLSAPTAKVLPVEQCRQVYDQQTAVLQASDLVVRYNLIDLLGPRP